MTSPAADAPAREAAVREQVRRCVRASLGREPEAIEAVGGGLGLRRFYRVALSGRDEPRSLIARVDAAPDPARWPKGVPFEPPLEPLRSFLADHGIPVPACYGGDGSAGIDLLEDLGDLTLEQAAASADPSALRSLYEEACDLVPLYQRARDPEGRIPSFQVHLSDAHFAYKAEFFVTWSLPRALGRAATPAERAVVEDAFGLVAQEARRAPARLAHRDLQSANLHMRAARPPGSRLAVIDLQGALLAPPEYDLVCLLRDSYVELSDSEVAHQLARIRPRLPDPPDADTFARRFDLLTLTRKGKDHALCWFTAESRGRRDYLRHAPRAVRALHAAARRTGPLDPRLTRLAELVLALPEEPCAR